MAVGGEFSQQFSHRKKTRLSRSSSNRSKHFEHYGVLGVESGFSLNRNKVRMYKVVILTVLVVAHVNSFMSRFSSHRLSRNQFSMKLQTGNVTKICRFPFIPFYPNLTVKFIIKSKFFLSPLACMIAYSITIDPILIRAICRYCGIA